MWFPGQYNDAESGLTQHKPQYGPKYSLAEISERKDPLNQRLISPLGGETMIYNVNVTLNRLISPYPVMEKSEVDEWAMNTRR
ncbi:hypothetical protein SAMN04487785_102269 [Dyella jiangningensis]|uniref:hypothetical protein n=1 Tax=Dyella sp. AtDHG13 TaxID=1938897 RepID=UPI000886DEC2|nr:hypothetical protein [Dyella sp. AtDHG13]PXV60547.1 hypothetical protein BDW41_102269 [Dyella sp. AtDHG13]SDJ49720.1 hypothetical protein SAMN04487785_102269 [Dyella jiangningensis]